MISKRAQQTLALSNRQKIFSALTLVKKQVKEVYNDPNKSDVISSKEISELLNNLEKEITTLTNQLFSMVPAPTTTSGIRPGFSQVTLAQDNRQKIFEALAKCKNQIKDIYNDKSKSDIDTDKSITDFLIDLEKSVVALTNQLFTMVPPPSLSPASSSPARDQFCKNFDYGASPYMRMDELETITDKKAAIRGDDLPDQCPFGLSVPQACNTAGDCVSNMIPAEIGGSETQNKNQALLNTCSEKCKCIYADKILDSQDKVVCKFGEASLPDTPAFKGSPIYPQVWSGLAGETNFPQGYYGDNMSSRNLYYGLFSLQGLETDDLLKIASQSKNQIIKALAVIKSKYPKEFNIVAEQVLKHINKTDTIK